MKALVVFALLGFVLASGYRIPSVMNKRFPLKQPEDTGLKEFKYGPDQRDFYPKVVEERNYYGEAGGEPDEDVYDSNFEGDLFNTLSRDRRSADAQIYRTRPSGDYDWRDD